MTPAELGFAAALAVTALVELTSRWTFGRGAAGAARRPKPTLAVGLIISTALLAGLLPGRWPGMELGPDLLPLVLASLPVFAAGLRTDFTTAATKRHFLGILAGALILFLAAYRIPWLTIPGAGTFHLSTGMSLLVTLFWVVVVAGIVEICSLLPLLAGAIAVAIGASVWLPLNVHQTASGLALSGALAGGVIGHGAAMLLKARSRPPEKADALVLGFFCAAATLTTFLKSVTLASVILPLAVVSVLVITAGLSSFERSVLLRASPRE